jgi:predicted metal-dependent hydrolase
LEYIRVFLQVSVGMVHAERRQFRPAVERLTEAIRAIDRTSDRRGMDLQSLRKDIELAVSALRAREPAPQFPLRRQG